MVRPVSMATIVAARAVLGARTGAAIEGEPRIVSGARGGARRADRDVGVSCCAACSSCPSSLRDLWLVPIKDLDHDRNLVRELRQQ